MLSPEPHLQPSSLQLHSGALRSAVGLLEATKRVYPTGHAAATEAEGTVGQRSLYLQILFLSGFCLPPRQDGDRLK